MLWTTVLRLAVEEFTYYKVDMFTWTGCGFGYFVLYSASDYSSALLVIISIEKCIALYYPFKAKIICTVRMARRVSLVTAVIFVLYGLQFFWLASELEDIAGSYCYRNEVGPR